MLVASSCLLHLFGFLSDVFEENSFSVRGLGNRLRFLFLIFNFSVLMLGILKGHVTYLSQELGKKRVHVTHFAPCGRNQNFLKTLFFSLFNQLKQSVNISSVAPAPNFHLVEENFEFKSHQQLFYNYRILRNIIYSRKF